MAPAENETSTGIPTQNHSADSLPTPGCPSSAPATQATSTHELQGLGGWLILVAIGLIAAMMHNGSAVFTSTFQVLADGRWDELTTPDSEFFHPLWAPLLAFEILDDVLFAIAPPVLLCLFFSRSRWFPRAFVSYLALGYLFGAADYMMGRLIPAVAEEYEGNTMIVFVRGLIAPAIWIPYMLLSRRVKNTFGGPNHRQDAEASVMHVAPQISSVE